jgi:hypothetical protein
MTILITTPTHLSQPGLCSGLEPRHGALIHLPQHLKCTICCNASHLCRLWRAHALKLEAGLLLNIGDAVLVLAAHQGDADASVAGTTGAAAAVDVCLWILWWLNL